MPTETPYTIADLARLTGVNVRTIRYYLSQGLLPASGESGPGAHYGEGHLNRLTLTKRLQREHLPLAEIRTRLAELSDDDVAAALATTQPAPEPPATSALDYVRSILGPPASSVSTPVGRQPAMPAMATASPMRAMRAPIDADVAVEAPAPDPASAPFPEPPTVERSQWERLSLGPNLELHVRRPLSRQEQKRVERLITIARQVLKEEQP